MDNIEEPAAAELFRAGSGEGIVASGQGDSEMILQLDHITPVIFADGHIGGILQEGEGIQQPDGNGLHDGVIFFLVQLLLQTGFLSGEPGPECCDLLFLHRQREELGLRPGEDPVGALFDAVEEFIAGIRRLFEKIMKTIQDFYKF